jgi:hypothetical protein
MYFDWPGWAFLVIPKVAFSISNDCIDANITTQQTNPKLAKKVKSNLDNAYSYLAGNAFGRDKKGRVQKDDSQVQAEIQAAHGGEEYTAYVYYEFEIV